MAGQLGNKTQRKSCILSSDEMHFRHFLLWRFCCKHGAWQLHDWPAGISVLSVSSAWVDFCCKPHRSVKCSYAMELCLAWSVDKGRLIVGKLSWSISHTWRQCDVGLTYEGHRTWVNEHYQVWTLFIPRRKTGSKQQIVTTSVAKPTFQSGTLKHKPTGKPNVERKTDKTTIKKRKSDKNNSPFYEGKPIISRIQHNYKYFREDKASCNYHHWKLLWVGWKGFEQGKQ